MDKKKTAETDIAVTEKSKPEKMFTQEDVNRIVNERLSKSRAKGEATLRELKEKTTRLEELEKSSKEEIEKAARESESYREELESVKKDKDLQVAKMRIANETGVNADFLNGSTEDECRMIAQNYIDYAEAKRQPVAPFVRDGGEVRVSCTTRADILSIKKESERIKAIQENIELFRS